MFEIRELTLASMALRVFIAVILGGALGLDRGLKNRPAGLRTYMLVCLGACIVMITNQFVYQAYGTGDPVRMGAQVISGIGFLGAGTIIVTTRNQIKGLTTAAGLWAAACVGLAIGIGLYEAAILGGVSVIFVLTVLQRWDYAMRQRARFIDVYVEMEKNSKLVHFVRGLRQENIEMSNLQIEREAGADNEIVAFIVTLKGEKHSNHNEMIAAVKRISEVAYVEEL